MNATRTTRTDTVGGMVAAMDTAGLLAQIERLERLHRVGTALSAERDKDRLLEMILLEAKTLCRADGGTLYLRTEDDTLRFAIMRTDSLGIALGGTTGATIALPDVPLFDHEGAPNRKNVAAVALLDARTVHIPDAYHADGFDFAGTKAFDAKNGYRSTSLLTIPLQNAGGRVIGVLQLLNARAAEAPRGAPVPFHARDIAIVEALASQAAVALDNQQLLDAQKTLMESFIKMLAAAIDAKSPYTGGHCERVPVLTEMLCRAACDATDGPLADFAMSKDEWYEVRIAAWLHDCGKVVTPTHVMDKATKLEAIYDRMHTVHARLDGLKKDARIACLEAQLAAGRDTDAIARAETDYTRRAADIDAARALLAKANIGGEFLPDSTRADIRAIGAWQIQGPDGPAPLLSDDEIDNLCIARGTLTEDERLVINGHMVQTIAMLESLPFPEGLKRVPELAGGHHEKLDGTGYPKGIYAGDLPVAARIMAIADVFEALTAQDRPYKKGKTLSETMRIMGFMKKDAHLDADLLDLFVTSGVYRVYAERYLPPHLIDTVDEAAILAIQPATFELPDAETRAARKTAFLPAYAPQAARWQRARAAAEPT